MAKSNRTVRRRIGAAALCLSMALVASCTASPLPGADPAHSKTPMAATPAPAKAPVPPAPPEQLAPAQQVVVQAAAIANAGTGTVQGSVFDKSTSAAIQGICLYLYAPNGSYAGQGSCATATGSFSLDAIPPGTYTLAAFDPRGTRPTTWFGDTEIQGTASTFNVASGSSTSNINVRMAQLTGIVGSARDAFTGGPVAKPCAYATPVGPGAPAATCSTSATGEFVLSGLVPGAYEVAVVDPAGLHVTTRVNVAVSAGAMSPTTAAMPQITGVTGTILAKDTGDPIPNGCVMLYTLAGDYVPGSWRCTNAEGRYVIEGTAPGTYKVAYYDPLARFQTQWFDGAGSQAEASATTVVAGGTTTIGPARVTTFGSVSGRVVLANGDPAPGACVYANDLTGRYTGQGGCADQTGQFTFGGLPAGDYKVAAYGVNGSSGPFWYLGRPSEASATAVHVNGLKTTALENQVLDGPIDQQAPGPVTNLTATSASGTIKLTWDAPQATDLAGVTIRRAVGNAAPSSPTDGTAVAVVAAPSTQFTDTLVQPNTTYSYAVFAQDSVPNYSNRATVTVAVSTAPNVQQVCGTLGANTTWSPSNSPVYVLTCPVVVAPGVTLTIAAGTKVKAESGAYLSVQGSLVASGSAGSPVVFTSWRDDSVGGDTNGDGNGTGPSAGNWEGIRTDAQQGQPPPNISLSRSKVAYASGGVSASQSSVSVTNSEVSRVQGDGISVSSPVGIPTVTGNTVNNAGYNAISVSSANIDLGKLNGNSGSGNQFNSVTLSSDTVTVSSSLPWTGNLVPLLWSGCNAVTIAPSVTVTLNAGTVIKGGNNSCGGLAVQGSLVASGSAGSPVVFTSWRDDSVGGDTNGDGNATGPVNTDWYGINASPAGNGNPNPTVQLDRVKISWAYTGVSASQSSVSVTNSEVSRVQGDGISVSSPVGIPTVTGNTVNNAGYNAISVSSANIDLGKLNGNSGSGNQFNSVTLSSDTVTVSSSLPWTGNLVPLLWSGCNAVTIAPSVTVTLNAGTVIKGGNNSCGGLAVQGSLVASGSAGSPVVFTSWRDDSVGGDTNGDGNATGPVNTDWYGINASPAGNGNPNPTVQLDRVKISWAYTGVSASQSSVSVTNSEVSRVQGDGISVSSPVGIPTVTGNTVNNAGYNAISVSSANIDLGKLNGNSGSGNQFNSVTLSSDTVTVSSSLPWTGNLVPLLWSGCNAVTIAPSVTVTLNAGTVIKGGNNSCGGLAVQGSLVASGSAGSPVVFTSWRDDSVGGDTNGDGNATGPVNTDWYGINASPAGNGNPNPTVQLDRVKISWAYTGVSASQSSVSVTNSEVSRVQGDGISVSSPVGIPTVTGNTVNNAGYNAISVSSANIDLGKLNGNSGSGNQFNSVTLSSDTVTVSSSLPWTGNLVPLLWSGCNAVTIAPSVTVTLNAGTVIKGGNNSCGGLAVQGSLVASGSAGSPVVFTSWRDDSVGGDTNGDGNATGPVNTDWYGINASPAGNGNPNPTVQLDRVKISWAYTGVSASQSSVSVTNSEVSRVQGDGISVSSPVGIPTVTGNTVNNAGYNAISVSSANIDLGKLNGNSGSGNQFNSVTLSSDTVTVSSSLPWTGNLLPIIAGSLTVLPYVTVSVGPGAVVKVQNGSGIYIQGTLTTSGSAGSPVVFTSWRDDTVGGDSNGDGNTTSPALGDWYGISAQPAGNGNPNPTLTLNGVEIRYATTALDLATPAAAEIHGAIRQSGVGVSAGDNFVDATGVDWGDPSGPAPAGSGAQVLGAAVLFMPYVGYRPPPLPPPAAPQPVPADQVCDSYYYIGVRGSGEAPQGPPPNYGISDSPSDGMGARSFDTYYGFQQKLHELDPSKSVRPIGIRYKALGTVYNYINYGTDAYFDSINEGIDVTEKQVLDEIARCGGQGEKIVLSGYSQGALVVHSTLRSLAAFNPQALAHVAAVVLVADPAKVSRGGETLWEGENSPARESIYSAEGIYTKSFGNWFGSAEWFDTTTRGAGPLPASITSRTISICHDNDVVCSPGWGSGIGPHTSYSSSELNSMGRWAAELVHTN